MHFNFLHLSFNVHARTKTYSVLSLSVTSCSKEFVL
jgi:hypothetical protein